MKTRQAFAQALKTLRIEKDLTQEDFDEVSSRTYLSELERAVKSPTLEKLEDLSKILDVHPLSLLVLTYQYAHPRTSLDTLMKTIQSEIEYLIK